MKTVLITIEINTHFIELSRVARLLQKSGRYKPILWFKSPYNAIERDLAICHAEGWEYISSLPVLTTPSEKNQKTRSFSTETLKLKRSIERFIPSFKGLTKGIHQIYRIRHQIHQIQRLLVKIRPHLLIVAEDGYDLHILIRIGNAFGTPTVIIPFTIANATEAAAYFFDDPSRIISNKNLMNKVVGVIFPRWVYCYKGRKLLRLYWGDILAHELWGFAPRQPWVRNSEETSIIAVENEAMFQYYRKEGLPADRLIITGALYDDMLAEGLINAEKNRFALCKELDLPPNRPLLVCALPPSVFPPNQDRRKCKFNDYYELLRFWMQTLSAIEKWNIIVRPHPLIKEEEIVFLTQFGIRVTQIDTTSLVSLCDLYIASVSATIRWAIACGKPVVNYDVYNLDYADYVDVGGVITMCDKETFVNTIKSLTINEEIYNNLAARQQECMSKWGLLDGKSGERMLRLFDDVIKNPTERR